jgi:homoserine O-succinyltransferase/O-acetyltransferase
MMPVSPRLREPQPRDSDDDPIVIGLVNNMPDAALRTTERQFGELLSAASHNVAVSLRLFSLPELVRADIGRSYVTQHHEDIGELWASHLDGLIVTGTEPRAPALTDEPYWPTLTKLVDWAEDHTISTIWSCLAAHAAVFHIDGIGRCARSEKLSGSFDCVKAMDHAIVAGAPSRWRLPHSRYNELTEGSLIARGYHILSRSPVAGVDMFAKQRKSLFVFSQGHPEFDSGALLREYGRDIRRFLAGERDGYPGMPQGYFDEDTTAAFAAFRHRALGNRSIDVLSGLPAVAQGKLAHGWRGLAICLYSNWLSYLVEQKLGASTRRSRESPREC